MKARINRKAWSEESKRSYAYLSNDAYYEDEKYKCYKCGKTAVFSAQEQKKTYEEDKRYIWQKRTLCPSCYSTYNNINSKIYSFEKQTGSKYKSSSIDGSVIKEWLSMLKELPYLW
ncbi:MAG: zinc-ribbon domain containing protein [Candidatus Thiodiazotropha sp. LLP2]